MADVEEWDALAVGGGIEIAFVAPGVGRSSG
jgi:hypothetical protein